MLSDIKDTVRKFRFRFSLCPDILLISHDAWDIVRSETDALRYISNTREKQALLGMMVVPVSAHMVSPSGYRVAFAAWGE